MGFDEENEKFDSKVKIPENVKFEFDEKLHYENSKLVSKYFKDNYGNLDDFNFPINSKQAKIAFQYFQKTSWNFLETMKTLYLQKKISFS